MKVQFTEVPTYNPVAGEFFLYATFFTPNFFVKVNVSYNPIVSGVLSEHLVTPENAYIISISLYYVRSDVPVFEHKYLFDPDVMNINSIQKVHKWFDKFDNEQEFIGYLLDEVEVRCDRQAIDAARYTLHDEITTLQYQE